jgi:hypothetical protein
VTLLAESGYDGDTKRRGQPELLDLWAAAFPTGLARKLELASFSGDVDEPRMANAEDVAFVSGEQAVRDLLRPASMIVYVEKLDPRLPIVNRWRADGTHNILVRRAFWHAPEASVPRAGVSPASWPLVYADLLASNDPRVRGAAQEWRERHAGPE